MRKLTAELEGAIDTLETREREVELILKNAS